MSNLETQIPDSRPAGSVLDHYAEGQSYFMGRGSLNNTLAQLAADLKNHNIDYAVIGAVALLAHGYQRFTEDIDIVLTPDGLEAFHRELVGRGYAPAFTGARKKLRSTSDSVPIEVMPTGDYPGDGQPKPVTFPQPSEASIERDGVRFVTFEKLIELKLASGMTAADQLKDLADVQELIKIHGLQADFAERLDPFVRDRFIELAEAVRKSKKERE